MTTTLLDADCNTNVVSEQQDSATLSAIAEPIVKKRTRRKPLPKDTPVPAPETLVSAEIAVTPVPEEVVAAPTEAPVAVSLVSTAAIDSKPFSRPHPRDKKRPARPPEVTALDSATPQKERSAQPAIDWDALVAKVVTYNENAEMYWKVQALFETDKPYLHLVRKELNDAQMEIFEDTRVTDAVMRGSKPPSADEQWKRFYRDEMKNLQAQLRGFNVWIADTLPEKKHTLRWGEKLTRNVAVDKDSQTFFLMREQKQNKPQGNRNNKSKKSHRNAPRFG